MPRSDPDATWAKQALRDAALRATAARVAVLKLLGSMGIPMSHAEVVEALTEFGFDQSTLFRCLNEIADAGLVSRLDLGDQTRRFELRKMGEKVEFTGRREKKPTLYLFVPAEKFSRPTARLMRKLDEKVAETAADAEIVAVWVTGNVDETKAYLPRVQMSLKLDETTFCVFEGDASGPQNWGINTDADLTVVTVIEGQVKQSWGFVSANETVADQVLKSLH